MQAGQGRKTDGQTDMQAGQGRKMIGWTDRHAGRAGQGRKTEGWTDRHAGRAGQKDGWMDIQAGRKKDFVTCAYSSQVVKSPSPTFLVLTNLGHFDWDVTSLFQTMAGCPTTADLYNTSQVEMESTISANSNLPNINVSSFDALGIVRSCDCHKSYDFQKWWI